MEAAADVFAFASDQIYDLQNAGALADLSEYDEAFQAVAGKSLDDVKAANSESSVEAATIDGDMYAFPMAGDNSYFLYYHLLQFLRKTQRPGILFLQRQKKAASRLV